MQFEIFYILLTAPRIVPNTYAQVARAQSCPNHEQHIERSSRATCRIYLSFISLAELLTDEAGEETGEPGENLWLRASWTLHSVVAKKQNRRSTTSFRTVPSGSNRDTSYDRRVSQPPTSCGERREICAAPPSSWQHVDWGSNHG